MKTKRRINRKILWLIIPVVMIIGIVLRLKMNKEKTVSRVYQYDKAQEMIVPVDTVRMRDVLHAHDYSGTFEPDRESKISAEVQGKVTAVYAEFGDRVEKGKPLVQLDNTLLKLQLESVELQIASLEADVKRYKILAAADAIQGVQLEKAELGLATAIVQRNTLREQIAKTTITAPFSGIVTQKLTEVGAYAAPGVPVMQITDISHLRFTIWVPEKKITQFHVGDLHQITADVYPDWKLEGKVSMTGSKSNQGNSFPVQFRVANTKEMEIKAGMFGTVHTGISSTEKKISIPASSISGSGSSTQVYVIENGKAVLRMVRIEQRIKNQVIISSGLSSGDIIITGGYMNLYEGASVRPAERN
ncbi:MAG: efflux RND transporter periplasmic adaptor subunit [Candidatus Competibacteraceae bacterium]|nr:efflux RND transporter periplasmic adaptor subunit [Candidatus Competibacteraceae bacterium]